MRDEHFFELCQYLEKDPCLYSITVNNNPFTDKALMKLCNTLKKNTVLAHLSIKGCQNITNRGIKKLLEVVSYFNLQLF
jgi:hypothetical protein